MTRVPNEPLREAFLASGLSAVEVCYRMGCFCDMRANGRHRARSVPDTKRLRRVLGLERHRTGSGRPMFVATLDEAFGLALADALGVDFDALYGVQSGAGVCADCGEPLYFDAERCGFCESEREAMAA
jgi:hypothetical protein